MGIGGLKLSRLFIAQSLFQDFRYCKFTRTKGEENERREEESQSINRLRV